MLSGDVLCPQRSFPSVIILGWPKSSFRFFCKIANPREPVCVSRKKTNRGKRCQGGDNRKSEVLKAEEGGIQTTGEGLAFEKY